MRVLNAPFLLFSYTVYKLEKLRIRRNSANAFVQSGSNSCTQSDLARQWLVCRYVCIRSDRTLFTFTSAASTEQRGVYGITHWQSSLLEHSLLTPLIYTQHYVRCSFVGLYKVCKLNNNTEYGCVWSGDMYLLFSSFLNLKTNSWLVPRTSSAFLLRPAEQKKPISFVK